MPIKRSTLIFIIAAIIWQVLVAIIYGLFIRYNTASFFTTQNTETIQYPFADQTSTFSYYGVNGTQAPFPFIVLMFTISVMIVGLALVSAYIERSSVTNMAFTLLIFALTVQNFFIFRDFFDRGAVNNPNASTNYNTQYYQKVNLINFSNSLQTSFQYFSSSFFEAVGAALALYAGYSAVMGRIGLGEVFMLTLFGTFFYELNSQILWRLYITDNGFPSRAFAFGSTLGIVSSLILGKRDLTVHSINYVSSYLMRTLPFLGIILVWCTFPILVTGNLYNKVEGQIVAMAAQVNMWLALSGSVISAYIVSIFIYRKFSVYDMVFACITGGIAYSSSSDNNYNPGAALAIGSVVSFVCALCQGKLKRTINRGGNIDSNGVIFNFLIPSLFAAIFSAILIGFDQSFVQTNLGVFNFVTTYGVNVKSGRSATEQGGFMIAGWAISVAFGAIAGGIIGFFYRLFDQRNRPEEFFTDMVLFNQPSTDYSQQTKQ